MPQHIPLWMARPAAALSTVAALAGSAGLFLAAATGDYWWAVWSGVCFVGAALLWFLGDLAATSDRGAQPGR
jgi:protein-S-isoprenylcysteine O-methyltransferase Ste14